MRTETSEAAAESVVPEFNDLDEFTSYEDDDGLVVCDRTNPKAWICSDETWPLTP